jgi:hypothetical protein
MAEVTQREIEKLRAEIADLRDRFRLMLSRNGGYVDGQIRTTGDVKVGGDLSVTGSSPFADTSHNHDHGALTGKGDDDHTHYLLATGARTGASSQDQAFTNDLRVTGGGIYLGRNATPGTGHVKYTGSLYSYKNSTEYAVKGVKELTTCLTSTSWDGDAKSSNQSIDLSSVFGAPAGINAAMFRLSSITNDVSPQGFSVIKASSGAESAIIARTQVSDLTVDAYGLVPCSGGDIYYQQYGSPSYVNLQIHGYSI